MSRSAYDGWEHRYTVAGRPSIGPRNLWHARCLGCQHTWESKAWNEHCPACGSRRRVNEQLAAAEAPAPGGGAGLFPSDGGPE